MHLGPIFSQYCKRSCLVHKTDTYIHLKDTKLTDPITISEDSLFCLEKDDIRLQPMCCHFLSDSPCDILLGAEECTSPFGTYEISMPIDNKAPCEDGDTKLTSKNCKGFDVSFFSCL